jgi:hypothetical protein
MGRLRDVTYAENYLLFCMKLEVPPEILEQTRRCQKGFCCLSESGADLCPVEWSGEEGARYVRCLSSNPCRYQMPFGQDRVCTCPARLALFARYTL